MKKVLLILFLGMLGFLGFVSTRNGQFKYERSAVINAPAEKIYPFVSNFKNGKLWNPYDQKDPTMQLKYIGADGQVGSILEFDGNKDVGAGKLEITQLVPNQRVEIKLSMTRPMTAENQVVYQLVPEGSQTRFSWSMSGEGGFLGKLVSVFIDCEKMVSGDMEKGINNLKTLMETK